MKPRSKAAAYPGLPVVFAEGFRDYRRRLCGHNHASLAVTDSFERVRTETSAETMADGLEFTLDGKPLTDSRSGGVFSTIQKMQYMAAELTGVNVKSHNQGIMSGSSDSGAAALVTVLDDLLDLGLPKERLLELASVVSETAYRSLIGGLSEYRLGKHGTFTAHQIRDASFFRGILIYAIPFDLKRFSADDLHIRVIRHPHYGERLKETELNIERLHNLIEERDFNGFMRLMEQEARTVHTMFSELGMDVIKPPMWEVTHLVEQMRQSGTQAYWNVAGGSQVYVFTTPQYAKEVTRQLKDRGFPYKNYKVAGGAKLI